MPRRAWPSASLRASARAAAGATSTATNEHVASPRIASSRYRCRGPARTARTRRTTGGSGTAGRRTRAPAAWTGAAARSRSRGSCVHSSTLVGQEVAAIGPLAELFGRRLRRTSSRQRDHDQHLLHRFLLARRVDARFAGDSRTTFLGNVGARPASTERGLDDANSTVPAWRADGRAGRGCAPEARGGVGRADRRVRAGARQDRGPAVREPGRRPRPRPGHDRARDAPGRARGRAQPARVARDRDAQPVHRSVPRGGAPAGARVVRREPRRRHVDRRSRGTRVGGRATIEDVRAALDQLDPTFAQVYKLHTFDRLSYEEIASRLRIERVTVGTRLNRARKKLRDVLVQRLGLEETP